MGVIDVEVEFAAEWQFDVMQPVEGVEVAVNVEADPILAMRT